MSSEVGLVKYLVFESLRDENCAQGIGQSFFSSAAASHHCSEGRGKAVNETSWQIGPQTGYRWHRWPEVVC